jgi:polysaccharide deacetylase family protein (PEP-CTERM system associated)
MIPTILLTFDIEDWFQVENFKAYIPYSSWPKHEVRVEKNTHRILDLLDSIKTSNPINPTNPKATFFILGWIAERIPSLVNEIYNRGHEVASHGLCHDLIYNCSLYDTKKDLADSKNILEDLIGSKVYGYRAPSFSINNDFLKIAEESGYLYDSSYNSFGLHQRYGHVDLTGASEHGIASQISREFYELPISNLKFGKYNLPMGGGGYFRLLPSFIFRMGIRSILRKQGAYLFYMHPWEIDPDQPGVKQAPTFYKFRHYINLKRTYSKLTQLIKGFSKYRFITCCEYINNAKVLGAKGPSIQVDC